MNDLVSIVTPSYNTAEYIAKTIQSVLAQTYTDWELIIVDDCSEDDTDEIVKPFLADKRIRYLKNEKNSGAALSRNRALREAKGKWMAFLDSDDLWMPDKLEKQIGFMKEHGYGFSYTGYSLIDESGYETGVYVTGPRKVTSRGMRNYCWPGCLTVMYDKETVGLIQIEDIRKNNDYAMWLQVSKKTTCYYLNENLAMYRKRNGSISNHGYFNLIKWHYRLFHEVEKNNAALSAFCTLVNLFFGTVKKIKYHNKSKKICIIGHYANKSNLLNGQTVKTKIITENLKNRFGGNQICTVDTHGGLKSLLKSPFQIFGALKRAKNIIILPAQRGLMVYVPLLTGLRRLFKHRVLHYAVIGGWLPEFLQTRKGPAKKLKTFDYIYVETKTMKNALEKQGFGNVVVMPNCKSLHILSADELVYPDKEPYKLCTFSRVMKEMGIEDAVNAVTSVNEKCGKTVYTLDIYGQVDGSQTQWFADLQKSFPNYVKYGGLVDYDKSTDVLKNYFALLFPTYYDGEGFAGTILDAFASGIPVIASDWKYNTEIISDGVNGYIYKSKDTDELAKRLSWAAENPETVNSVKSKCIECAHEYTPEKVIDILAGKMA